MAIIVKSKKIKENIMDENGNILGIISYNPEDTTTYTRLTDIMNDLLKIGDEMKQLNNIKKIPEDGLNNIEEFNKYKDDFDNMNKSLHRCDERIENIKKSVDEIFGLGTSKIIMEDTNDVDMLVPLIDEVLPKFKQARNSKVNKHLKSEAIEVLDVME